MVGTLVSSAVGAPPRLSRLTLPPSPSPLCSPQVRVVSMPCWELFEEQPQSYIDSVLPPEVTARVSVEAGSTYGWQKWVGGKGKSIGIDEFGASAPGPLLYEKYGITGEWGASKAGMSKSWWCRRAQPTAWVDLHLTLPPACLPSATCSPVPLPTCAPPACSGRRGGGRQAVDGRVSSQPAAAAATSRRLTR